MNIVVIRGTLSSPPIPRDLPSGDRLVAFEVTVREADQPTDSVPVVWFDPPARAAEMEAGTLVTVTGRVRRRFFRTGGGTRSRTEVVADLVAPMTQRARTRRALEQVGESLAQATASGR